MSTPVKKTVKAKVVAVHPKYNEMVVAAISALKERSGSSRTAILKYIAANYKLGNDDKKINVHLKTCLRNGVTNGLLKQVKGTGATGSFKVAVQPKPVKKVVKKVAASPKKVVAKKTSAKKIVKKTTKKTTVKKAVKASPKKASPKKVVKKAVAKKVTKKVVSKKSVKKTVKA